MTIQEFIDARGQDLKEAADAWAASKNQPGELVGLACDVTEEELYLAQTKDLGEELQVPGADAIASLLKLTPIGPFGIILWLDQELDQVLAYQIMTPDVQDSSTAVQLDQPQPLEGSIQCQ